MKIVRLFESFFRLTLIRNDIAHRAAETRLTLPHLVTLEAFDFFLSHRVVYIGIRTGVLSTMMTSSACWLSC